MNLPIQPHAFVRCVSCINCDGCGALVEFENGIVSTCSMPFEDEVHHTERPEKEMTAPETIAA